jgi:hypothetical protein
MDEVARPWNAAFFQTITAGHKQLHQSLSYWPEKSKGLSMAKFRDIRSPSKGQGNIGGIASAVVFALILGAIGAYAYEIGTWNPIKHTVPDKDVPSAPLLHLPSHTPHPDPQ